jgi:hypothetical protein
MGARKTLAHAIALYCIGGISREQMAISSRHEASHERQPPPVKAVKELDFSSLRPYY